MDNYPAFKIAQRIVTHLEEYCDRIEIAGSLRRGRPQVGDVDLVVLPKSGQEEALRARIKAKTRVISEGPQALVVAMNLPAGAKHSEPWLQIDTWFAKRPDPDLFASTARPASNFGTLLVCRTGSTAHNVRLCQQATKLLLHWNPHAGVMRGQDLIASAEEEDVFAALQLPWIPPAFREEDLNWAMLPQLLAAASPVPGLDPQAAVRQFAALKRSVQ